MSFRKNVVASYVSQIYATLIGILIVPVYIRYMGIEAYGLVGFYAMMQAWFQLLDLGLAPTLSRQTARYAGGAIDGLMLRRLLRVLEAIFVAVAVSGALALSWGSGWVASHWLQVGQLPVEQVQTAVILMAGIIGLRWIAGLYRGAIGGFEQQVWLGRLNVATATARFVFVLAIFEWVGTTPAHFFGYQLLVALVETSVLIAHTYRLLPRVPAGTRIGFDWKPLSGVLRFSLSIAFTSAVWIGVTQTDKLLLSRLLPLTEYAQFTLAVLVASGVSIVSGPLSTALLPRLSRLQAQQDEAGLINLYRQATQGIAVIAVPIALVLACGAEPLLRAWTGDVLLAAQAAPILQLYALGNGILALSAFPYYLQFAKGDVRLHLIGNVFLLLLLIPSVWFATVRYGALGAGWAWLGSNIIYVICWIPFVHRHLSPGLHLRWLFHDITRVLIGPIVLSVIFAYVIDWPVSRLLVLVVLFGLSILFIIAGALGSSVFRPFLMRAFKPVSALS